MNRTDLTAAVFAKALAEGKTVAEASVLAEGVSAIPEGLLAILAPSLLGKTTTPAATATSVEAAGRPLSVSGTPLTDKQVAARLERLEHLEAKDAERRAKSAAKCPIQPVIFMQHAEAVTANHLRGVLIEGRGFKFDTVESAEGKAIKTPGTARSCGYWGQFKVTVRVVLPGGATQDVTLNGQATCTVIGSKDWTQERRNAWIAENTGRNLPVFDLVGHGLEQGTDKDGDTRSQDSAMPRTFDGGSVGYYLSGKSKGFGEQLQVGINLTLPGSKHAVGTV